MFSLYCEEAQTPGQFRNDLRRIVNQGEALAVVCSQPEHSCLCELWAIGPVPQRPAPQSRQPGWVDSGLLRPALFAYLLNVLPSNSELVTLSIHNCSCPAAKARIKDEDTCPSSVVLHAYCTCDLNQAYPCPLQPRRASRTRTLGAWWRATWWTAQVGDCSKGFEVLCS